LGEKKKYKNFPEPPPRRPFFGKNPPPPPPNRVLPTRAKSQQGYDVIQQND